MKTDSLKVEKFINALRVKLPDFKRRYGLKTLGLFGSYVRGEDNEESDLDVLVEYERTPTLLQLSALQREITQAVGVKVDLVLKKTIKPGISERILSEAVYL